MNYPDLHYVKAKGAVWEDVSFQTIITGFNVETRWVKLTEHGRLHVKAGYPWDFATGAVDTESIIKASLVHDIFCELINDGLLPEHVQVLADEQFRMIAKAEDMTWFRRMYAYTAVRLYQINKKRACKRKVYTV